MSEVIARGSATPFGRGRIASWLSPRKIGAIYVWIVFIVIFSILSPEQFPQYATVQQVLNTYSVTLLVALGLLMPLAAGLYDLSVGAVVGLSGIGAAWFLANVSANPWLALLVGLAVGVVCALLNILVVIGMKVDSFIGTLATSSILAAIVLAVSGSSVISDNVGGTFQQDFALKTVKGLSPPVFLMIAGVLVLAFILEKTAFGRRVYATGFDTEVARLGGVDVGRLRAVTLLASASFAALAGVMQTAALGAGDPTVGPSYLLPAFAAAFLGATQFRSGRVNPWGTAVAGLLLGTADVGLLLAGSPQWGPDVLSGGLLIIAVALTRANIRLRFKKPVRPRSPRSTEPGVTSASLEQEPVPSS